MDVDDQRKISNVYHQQVLFYEEIDSDSGVYNLEAIDGGVSLRRPLDEEIARYIVALATQARSSYHLRNTIVGGE